MMLRQAQLLKAEDVIKIKHDRYSKGEFVIMSEPRSDVNKKGFIRVDAHPVNSGGAFVPVLEFHVTDLVEIIHQ